MRESVGCHSVERLAATPDDDHLGACGGEAPRQVGADAGATAGDQHTSPVERHARITSCARWARRMACSRPGQVGKRPLDVGVLEGQPGAQRPVRIGQVWAGEADQVGAARHQDRVDVVGFVDVADRHRGDARLVADPVGERRLEHAPVHGLRVDRGLPGGDVDDVGAGLRRTSTRSRPPRRA